MKPTYPQLLKNVIDHSPMAVCIINAEITQIEIYNDKFLHLFDVASRASTDQPLLDFLNSEFHADHFLISKVIEEQDSFTGDELTMALNRNGDNIEVKMTPLYAPLINDQEVITRVAIWMTESYERKIDTVNHEDISSDRDHINDLLTEIPAGTAILSGKNLVFELVNPTYQNLVPGRELIGKPFLEALPELVGSELEKSLKRVYTEGVSLSFRDDLVPLSNIEIDELEQRYFTYRLIPKINDDGSIDGIFIFTSEVTHEVDNKVNSRKDKQ